MIEGFWTVKSGGLASSSSPGATPPSLRRWAAATRRGEQRAAPGGVCWEPRRCHTKWIDVTQTLRKWWSSTKMIWNFDCLNWFKPTKWGFDQIKWWTCESFLRISPAKSEDGTLNGIQREMVPKDLGSIKRLRRIAPGERGFAREILVHGGSAKWEWYPVGAPFLHFF